jgi:hypothetical protein
MYNLKKELDALGHAVNLTTTHSAVECIPLPRLTIRCTSILVDNPDAALLKAIDAKKELCIPLLSNFKPLGFIFHVLAFNSYGAAHNDVRVVLSELSAKAQSRTHSHCFQCHYFFSPMPLKDFPF